MGFKPNIPGKPQDDKYGIRQQCYVSIAHANIYMRSQAALGRNMQQPYMVRAQVEGARLYQQYAPAIFAYLLRSVGSREDAEDLLLDLPRFSHEGAFFVDVKAAPLDTNDTILSRATRKSRYAINRVLKI